MQDEEQDKQQNVPEGSDQQENDPRGEGIEGGSASAAAGETPVNPETANVPEGGEGQGPGEGEGSRPGKSTQ